MRRLVSWQRFYLEAISGHQFPAKDGLYTRFITELVLRREPTFKFGLSITPGSGRSPGDTERMRRFIDFVRLDQPLDSVIERAKKAMRLLDSKRFGTDVLRAEISGPGHDDLPASSRLAARSSR